jgi:hypothetical protein
MPRILTYSGEGDNPPQHHSESTRRFVDEFRKAVADFLAMLWPVS